MQSSDLMPEVDDNGSKSLSLDEAARSVGALQKHFHHLDEMSGTMMKQAGLNTKAHRVHLKNYPWKADDAAWFQAHPDRSHRLRPMFDGELDSMSTEVSALEIPKNHRLEILVRQIEPTKRIRTLFCRNIETPIPDIEQVIHALFDAVSDPNARGVISVEKVAAMAKKYQSISSRPN